ncbi:hypothetical protein B5P46_11675 [Rhizobium leguminosarum]|uniref:Uncharacterized protein n=1 Tax=Rhizobium leguminosarum TaxID=384 RepID=A0A4Q1UBH3_RHILE|nr:hypothetical protein [Rhizobium leguminosarum]RXT29334.1 hypothetical protein B5P46_11675 [Rhizobium leguminosarum]
MSGEPLELRMSGEPQIEINGTKLSEGQAMALRVACTSFFQKMSEGDSPLGPDELGRRMAALYRERLREVLWLISAA